MKLYNHNTKPEERFEVFSAGVPLHGAMTLSIMKFSVMTFSIMIFSIVTLSIMTFSIMTLSITINKMRHSAQLHSS